MSKNSFARYRGQKEQAISSCSISERAGLCIRLRSVGRKEYGTRLVMVGKRASKLKADNCFVHHIGKSIE